MKERNIFPRCGVFCASRPGTVLLISVCFIIVLCSGVTQLTLTVDPIKLWAAPTSRARIERDFFEQTFRPFYRYQNTEELKYSDHFTGT